MYIIMLPYFVQSCVPGHKVPGLKAWRKSLTFCRAFVRIVRERWKTDHSDISIFVYKSLHKFTNLKSKKTIGFVGFYVRRDLLEPMSGPWQRSCKQNTIKSDIEYYIFPSIKKYSSWGTFGEGRAKFFLAAAVCFPYTGIVSGCHYRNLETFA